MDDDTKRTVSRRVEFDWSVEERQRLRRKAAFRSTSRAHVTGFASPDSAADSTSRFSAAVIGIFIESVRRSIAALGGLPRIRFNIRTNYFASSMVFVDG